MNIDTKNIYDQTKWGVRVCGTDTILACHSFEQAVFRAGKINTFITRRVKPESNSPHYPLIFAQVDKWENMAGNDTPHEPDSVDMDGL